MCVLSMQNYANLVKLYSIAKTQLTEYALHEDIYILNNTSIYHMLKENFGHY